LHDLAMLRALIAALAIWLPGAALADPCEAISPNKPLPAYLNFGETFSGPVVQVLDGDSLYVAMGPSHEKWVEVRLADFFAPEAKQPGGPAAKAALERIALGRQAVCIANLPTYDRIAARCSIDGRAIGDEMRAAGINEGGNAGQKTGRSSRLAQPLQSSPGVFRNCGEARAAGVAPMYRGSPGYSARLDRDGDGIACEPYHGG
jgi:hypothetical protein